MLAVILATLTRQCNRDHPTGELSQRFDKSQLVGKLEAKMDAIIETQLNRGDESTAVVSELRGLFGDLRSTLHTATTTSDTLPSSGGVAASDPDGSHGNDSGPAATAMPTVAGSFCSSHAAESCSTSVNQCGSCSSSTNRRMRVGGWRVATTADGVPYYYHKVTFLSSHSIFTYLWCVHVATHRECCGHHMVTGCEWSGQWTRMPL